MPSYIPEHCYGLIPGTHDQYGLIPWPAHLQPRAVSDNIELTKKGEAYAATHEALPDINLREMFGEPDAWRAEADAMSVPRVVEADGVFFLTLSNDRATVAYTIQRLIDMLDAMDGDSDFEPYLADWHQNDRFDDREFECDDEGAQCDDEGAVTGDDEYSLGWQDDSNQEFLSVWGDYEADLGTTEEIDQVRRQKVDRKSVNAWLPGDGEPDLGFVGHGTGWRKGEETDDREGGSELEGDPAESGIADEDALALMDQRPSRTAVQREPYRVRITSRPAPAVPVYVAPSFTASDFDRLPWA